MTGRKKGELKIGNEPDLVHDGVIMGYLLVNLLAGADTPRTRLKMARRLPVPIPPEPFAYPLIQTMRHAVAASDANGGKDGPLLKLAGLFGVGFDS